MFGHEYDEGMVVDSWKDGIILEVFPPAHFPADLWYNPKVRHGPDPLAGSFIMRSILAVSVCVLFLSFFFHSAAALALDSDGDGLTDTQETGTYGTDPLDADTDNDGANDYIEVTSMGTSPLDADTDDDGISDNSEASSPLDSTKFDTDGDGLGDGQEIGKIAPIPSGFSDGSSIPYSGTNPAIFRPDNDPATHTDPLDWDTDDDGLSDSTEDQNRNGFFESGEMNPLDADTDDDGLSDGSEDSNHNGHRDTEETDPADFDSDNDQLGDGQESGVASGVAGGTSNGTFGPLRVTYDGTSGAFVPDGDPGTTTQPLEPDSDYDNLNDGTEDADHDGVQDPEETDPNNQDSDGDQLLDGLEVLTLTTNPVLWDTDLDSISDFDETDGGNLVDTDGDSVIDAKDTDSDGDGILDITEGVSDLDGDFLPNYRDLDDDGDGILDAIEGEGDPDGDTEPNYRDLDSDGDGILDATEGEGDPDGDLVPNFLDLDSDGDGYGDGDPLEGLADNDNDGIPNYLDPDSPAPDTDGDGLDDDVENGLGTNPGLQDSDSDGIDDYVETDGGQPTDTDGDTVIDALDADSDNDGITDMIEGAVDSDADGQPDYRDLDSDGDTLADSDEGTGDPDTDGIPNYLDLDSDGDGDSDTDEAAAGSDPYDPLSNLDTIHSPVLGNISDVGNDQGRRVRLGWQPSNLDVVASPEPILSYSVYRRIDADKAANSGDHVTCDKAGGLWDFVLNLPATGDTVYNTLAETLCDSTMDGICWSVFFVRGHTAVPTVFYDSVPDSGYSVDNLAPGAPAGFTVAYGPDNDLSWEPSEDADFSYFRIYRCSTAECTPGPGDLVQATVQTQWTDTDGSFTDHYVISAVDFAGNESLFSSPGSVSAADEVPGPVDRLLQNTPNPFNPRTTISFSLAQPEPVTLAVYDLSGRLVKTLIAGETLAAGPHEAVWNGRDDAGRPGSTGVYFYCLRTSSHRETRMMTMLR